MPALTHLVVVISYLLVSGAVAVALPQYVRAFDARTGVELGGVFLMICAACHFVMLWLVRDREVASEIGMLKGAMAQLRGDIGRAREEARRILEIIEASGNDRQGSENEIRRVVAEMQVLHGLVDQRSAARAAASAVSLEARETLAADIAQAHVAVVEERMAASGGGGSSAALAEQAEPLEPVPETVARAGVPGRRVITGLNETQVLDLVRDGLRNSRVDLFLQPIVSLPQRKHRHYECFSRIRADAHSMIVPDQYLAIAEREGLIAAIDNMLLFRCVQLLRRVNKKSFSAGMFVNLSEHTLANSAFFRDFVAFMETNRELVPNIVFEFAQAHVDRHGHAVRLDLERLARMGFRFSMDQVTNLDIDVADLGRRHIRFIKIEAARLLQEASRGDLRLDVRALKRALDAQGIDLIADKIESESLLVELLDTPIDFGQGYLFGEPRLSRDS